MERVTIVDERDVAMGTMDRHAAHRAPGVLHRAISVFVFDEAGRILLQQRADRKPLFAGRWANTCCTHPRPDEGLLDAGARRTMEEMGVETELRSCGSFVYRAVDPGSGLVEHEIDHVLAGRFGQDPKPDLDEVRDWEWIEPAALALELRRGPRRFAPWLGPALDLALRPVGSRGTGSAASGRTSDGR